MPGGLDGERCRVGLAENDAGRRTLPEGLVENAAVLIAEELRRQRYC